MEFSSYIRTKTGGPADESAFRTFLIIIIVIKEFGHVVCQHVCTIVITFKSN